VSPTAISAFVPRRRNSVRGEIVSVVSYQRPWVRTDAEISDGTGTLVLRFFGRASVPGFANGRHVLAQGTPGLAGGRMVMINPLYSFTTGDRAPGTNW
jgi:hypothetical protein